MTTRMTYFFWDHHSTTGSCLGECLHKLCTLSLLMMIAACGQESDPLIAQVGSHKITAAFLRTFVSRLPDGQRTEQRGDAARRHLLQSLIDHRLLLMEAEHLGLDTTSAVYRVVSDAVDGRVSALYRSRAITPKAAVPEEEVRRVFAAEGFDHERKVSAILVETREEIEAVRVALDAGRPFAEVARVRSLDRRSAEKGGELGFVSRDIITSLHIPAAVFVSLPLDQVSPPLQFGVKWHVVLFTEERPVPYEHYRPFIEERLFKQALVQVETEHFEQLKETFHAALETSGLRQFVAAFAGQQGDILETSTAPLFTFADSSITVAAAWSSLVRRNIRRGLADSVSAHKALEHFVLHPALLRAAARRAGLYDAPEIRQLANRVKQDALLEVLRKTQVHAAPVADAEVWEYYDTYPERFHHEKSIRAEELLLATEAEAREIKEALGAGIPFADLADRSLRPRAVGQQAQYHFHPRDIATYPHLIPALEQAVPEKLTGPIQVAGGFSVFRVLAVDPGGLEPFAAVQRRARALLRLERENQALETYVQDLRDRYADQISIYADRLTEALPDSLLGG